MGRLSKSFLALLLAIAVWGPGAGRAKDSSKFVVPTIPKSQAYSVPNPIVFYLAKGAADSCGPGCSEWIVAEGRIDVGAAKRMRTFLNRQPASKRPIYFNVSGGLLDEAMGIGRLMRERGMTARVAQTRAKECEIDHKKCEDLVRAGKELEGATPDKPGNCSSACIFAIVGARVREISPEAHLGVHSGKLILLGKYPKGSKAESDAIAAANAEDVRTIKRYLIEMGVPPAFEDMIEKIPFERPRPLTRDEVIQFGIEGHAKS